MAGLRQFLEKYKFFNEIGPSDLLQINIYIIEQLFYVMHHMRRVEKNFFI